MRLRPGLLLIREGVGAEGGEAHSEVGEGAGGAAGGLKGRGSRLNIPSSDSPLPARKYNNLVGLCMAFEAVWTFTL
jgi:hypothetical protein